MQSTITINFLFKTVPRRITLARYLFMSLLNEPALLHKHEWLKIIICVLAIVIIAGTQQTAYHDYS